MPVYWLWLPKHAIKRYGYLISMVTTCILISINDQDLPPFLRHWQARIQFAYSTCTLAARRYRYAYTRELTLTNTSEQHLPLVGERITRPARTRNTIPIWIWMPYEVTHILLPPGPPSFALFCTFFTLSSLSLTLSSSPCSFTHAWARVEHVQRETKRVSRRKEVRGARWPRGRGGKTGYGERKIMSQEEERGYWMRICEMILTFVRRIKILRLSIRGLHILTNNRLFSSCNFRICFAQFRIWDTWNLRRVYTDGLD